MPRASNSTAQQGLAPLRPLGHSNHQPALQPPPPTSESTRPQHTRPLHPTRPPPPPPSQVIGTAAQPLQSVRFRPDRPRQPELLRKLEERHSHAIGPAAQWPCGPAPPRLPLQSVRPRQPQHPPAPQSVRPRQSPALKPYQLRPKRGQRLS